MADPLRDKIAALVNATTIRPIDLPDKIAPIVRAHATNDAAVEAAADALWEHFCPGIRINEPDKRYYRQGARAAITAALGAGREHIA